MSKVIKKKEDKKKVMTIPTLIFLCKLAWKNKPEFILLYLLQLVAEVCNTMVIIIIPKYIIDDLVQIVGGVPFSHFQKHIIVMTGILIGVSFLASMLMNASKAWRAAIGEWFNRYLEEQIANHAMRMDFEYTEDSKALDQLNKAKEGISWYSGGVSGILDNFYAIIMNATVLAGVVTIVAMGCPWLLLIQGSGLLVVTYFNYKNNKLEVESFMALSVLNRKFGYFFYQLADFRYGKDIRLYDSVDMMGDKADAENRKMLDVWRNRSLRTVKNSWGIDISNSLRDGSSYFYIGYLALTKVISIGDLSMYTSAASNFFWSIWRIVNAVQEVIKRCNYIYEYIRFMEYPAAMEKGTEPVSEGRI